MKNMIIAIIITSIIGMIMYPVFDIIWCNFITHSHFTYSIYKHIFEPTIFATIISIVLFLPRKK